MLSVCAHDCPSACGLVVSVENGRLTDVAGNPEHPFTQGVICGKVRAYAERVHSELRVRTPLRRRGPKGAGEFVRVSWDEAIEEIVRRWRAIMAEDGGEAILPFSHAGTMGQVQYYAGHPLFHALGATRLRRTICVTTAYAGWQGCHARGRRGGGGSLVASLPARRPLGQRGHERSRGRPRRWARLPLHARADRSAAHVLRSGGEVRSGRAGR